MSTGGDTCSLCGRLVRDDPHTPGCYRGRCSTYGPGQRVPAKRTESEIDELMEATAERIEGLAMHPRLAERFQERARTYGLEPV